MPRAPLRPHRYAPSRPSRWGRATGHDRTSAASSTDCRPTSRRTEHAHRTVVGAYSTCEFGPHSVATRRLDRVLVLRSSRRRDRSAGGAGVRVHRRCGAVRKDPRLYGVHSPAVTRSSHTCTRHDARRVKSGTGATRPGTSARGTCGSRRLPDGSPFAPRAAFAGRDARTLAREVPAMDVDDYRAAFRGSALKRATLPMVKHHAAVVSGDIERQPTSVRSRACSRTRSHSCASTRGGRSVDSSSAV